MVLVRSFCLSFNVFAPMELKVTWHCMQRMLQNTCLVVSRIPVYRDDLDFGVTDVLFHLNAEQIVVEKLLKGRRNQSKTEADACLFFFT